MGFASSLWIWKGHLRKKLVWTWYRDKELLWLKNHTELEMPVKGNQKQEECVS